MLIQAEYEQRDDRPIGDQVIRLSDVDWDDYQRLLEMRGDHSAPRIKIKVDSLK